MLLNQYKLPDQEEYLLDLKNNSYSPRTTYNYSRDLSIFARFLNDRGDSFKDVNKITITHYKGYLQAGDHLKVHESDKKIVKNLLNKSTLSENALDTANVDGRGSKGSKTADLGFEDLRHLEEMRSNPDLNIEDVFGARGVSNKGLNGRSINRMLSAIRSYLKWCVDFDIDVPIAPEAIKLIKTDRKKSQVAELDDLIRLIEFPSSYEKDHRVAARNRAMLEMLFSTGMRISELLNLNLEQINNEGKIFIMGKGRKERFVYLTDRAKLYLNEYLQVRNDESKKKTISNGDDNVGVNPNSAANNHSDQNRLSRGSEKVEEYVEKKVKSSALSVNSKNGKEAVFIPYRGGRNGRKNKRISANYLQEKIAEYRRALGIIVPTSAHSLRHGFATYLAENGANPAAIQILLGHQSLQTTTRYVHASDTFAERTHRKDHPLKK